MRTNKDFFFATAVSMTVDGTLMNMRVKEAGRGEGGNHPTRE